MPHKKITGIYKIVNTTNNKIYIGSAVSIYNRFSTHKRLLRNNNHFNSHLQSAWNRYGENKFTFEIEEECLPELLREREEHAISTYKSNDNRVGYNRRINCQSNLGIKVSEETKRRLSISHMGHKRSPEAQQKISVSQYEPVCQINKDGNLINTFKSMLEAEEKTGIYRQAISGCCRKITKSAKGFIWCYEKEYKNFKLENYEKRSRWD